MEQQFFSYFLSPSDALVVSVSAAEKMDVINVILDKVWILKWCMQGLACLQRNWAQSLGTFFFSFILWIWWLWGNAAVHDANGKKLPGATYCFFGKNPIVDFRNARLQKAASKLIREYFLGVLGDGQIFSICALGVPLIITGNPEVVKTVLAGHHEKFPKSPRYNRLRYFLREGLVTSSGLKWQTHRRIINKGFAAEKFSNMVKVFIDKTEEQVTRWKDQIVKQAGSAKNSMVTNLNIDLSTLTTVIICKTAFSYDVDFNVRDENSPFGDVNMLLEEINRRLVNPTDWWHKLHPMQNARIAAEQAKTDKLVDSIVKTRLEQRGARKAAHAQAVLNDSHSEVAVDIFGNFSNLSPSKEPAASEEEEDHPNDLLDILLDSCDEFAAEGKPSNIMTPAELRDHIITFLAAGHETTATTLTWLLYELCLNPECQKKAQAEVDEVLRGRRVIMEELYSSFPYVNQMIKEATRLHPAVPTIARLCAENTVIEYSDGVSETKKKYIVKAGTNIACSISALHKNPLYWNDPEKFDPDRFHEDVIRTTLKHPFQFVPFSAGPRNCIGQRFASLELIAIVVTLMQNFSVSLTKENLAAVSIEETVVQAPKNLNITLAIRDEKLR